ncbi:hypothetical protein KM043_014407 [Ampulex compressa]|nr:hypothetical protein KM043_014407 [Ampulex compressa]
MKFKKEKHKKSKKKARKHEKRDKHRKRSEHSESSSSSNNSDEESQIWVEKKVHSVPKLTEKYTLETTDKQKPLHREEWMSMNCSFPCFSRSDQKKDDSVSNKSNSLLDKPGQSSRELNPYWKNNGNGLPPTIKEAEYKNQLEKNLPGNSKQLIELAKTRERYVSSSHSSREKYNRRRSNSPCNVKVDGCHGESYDERYKHTYKHSSQSNEYNKQKQKFKRPVDDDYHGQSSSRSYSRTKNWVKDKVHDKVVEHSSNSSPLNSKECNALKDNADIQRKCESDEGLTEAEMNKLGAQIVKAEIMGDSELATELKRRLENARKNPKKVSGSGANDKSEETVILTRTDEKGITRPIKRTEHDESVTNYKRKRNMPTHVLGERVRHYVDDDKYSLHQIFEREKGRSASEDDAVFVKLAAKSMDMEDIFEQEISQARSSVKRDQQERALAIKEHKRLTKSLDNCRWCINSDCMQKHLIVSMNSKVCLSLPSNISLTDGHCILTPVEHTSNQLQLEEDVWEQLKVLKQALIEMYTDQNQCPVFFETYMRRHQFPHMQLNCIPLPRKIGDMAPMYFKKALLECETEWSINKKVIDIKQKDVRHVLPNGLAYFAVQFGLQDGYAHVIEDERLFPKNFAEEIIGGMLNLDYDLWRKPRHQRFDEQSAKVLQFIKKWEKYNPLTLNKDD